MTRRWLLVLLATLTALVMVSPAVAAPPGSGGTYLALGDSVAAGTQVPAFFTDNGYTDAVYERLSRTHGFDEFVNLACPGDDTVEMLFGTGPAGPSLCYGPNPVLAPGGTSQLDAAVAHLTTNPGEVELITIAIGANDLLACDPSDPAPVVNACVAAQLGQIGANLPVIIGTLQTVAPDVPIVAMNYYNPNLAFWITGPAGQALADMTQSLTVAFNGTLQAVYDIFGVPVVDVADAFNTFRTNGNTPKNVREVCALTLMCERHRGGYVLSDSDPNTPGPQTDIHPSDRGYDRIARAHLRLIGDLGLLN